jgi:hypothetical protein
MKRTFFVCLSLCLIATFLLSQSNSVPSVNQSARAVAPTSASRLTTERSRAAAQATPAQTSGPNFAPAVTYDSGGYSTFSMAVADVNGDSNPDLVVANEYTDNGGSVGVLLGNGDGTFQSAATYATGGAYPYSVAVADVNGDGKPDLVVANQCANNSGNCGNGDNGIVGVLLGNGDGTFQTAVAYSSGGYGALSVAVADVNGDGKPDLVVANQCADSTCATNGTVAVLLGNGDGTFQTAVAYSSGGYGALSVAVADVNGDGKPDLLVGNQCESNSTCANGGMVGVLLGKGDGTFQSSVSYGAGGFDRGTLVGEAVGDVNGDGKPDLVVADCGGWCEQQNADGSIGILLGNGDGTFQSAIVYDSGAPAAESVAVMDVNGDGKPDVLVANSFTEYKNGGSGDGTVGVLINTSLGSTTTAPTSSPNPSNFGQAEAFTATVTPGRFFKFQPTGTVTFTYGSTTLCNALTLVGGIVTCEYSTLPAGTDTVTATYSGDANFAPSNGIVSQTVNKPTTTTTLTSSLSPSSFNQQVTFAATVTGQFGGTPTGAVTFTYGSATLCNTVKLSGGKAICTYSALPVGSDIVTATYSGDGNFTGSTSNALSQIVQGTYGVVSPTAVNFGQVLIGQTSTQKLISLKNAGTSELTVSNISIGGDFALPENRCAEGVKPSTHCNVEVTFTPHTPGTQTGTLTFTDNASNSPQTVSLTGTGVVATTTTLSSSPNPSTYGLAVTFTAVVTPAPPDGETVSFMRGTTVLGTGTLSGGSAVFTTSALKVGTTSVAADYSGDSDFKGSKSKPVKQVVKRVGE